MQLTEIIEKLNYDISLFHYNAILTSLRIQDCVFSLLSKTKNTKQRGIKMDKNKKMKAEKLQLKLDKLLQSKEKKQTAFEKSKNLYSISCHPD